MILLPDERSLHAANWVTRGLLEQLDARPGLPAAVAEKILWCRQAEFYTLDLRGASAADLAALLPLVTAVIAETEVRGAASFQQPEMFPAYLGKLRELRVLLDPSARRLQAATLFDYGSENAPDSPMGLFRLVIQPDGRFRFQNVSRGKVVVDRTGSVAHRALEEIAAHLAAADFPVVPEHPRPPGGDDFTITSGDRLAFLSPSGARDFPGYGPLIRRVVAWMEYLVACEGEAPAELRVDPPKGA